MARLITYPDDANRLTVEFTDFEAVLMEHMAEERGVAVRDVLREWYARGVAVEAEAGKFTLTYRPENWPDDGEGGEAR